MDINDLLRLNGTHTHTNRYPHQLNEGSQRSRYEYIQRLVNDWWRTLLISFPIDKYEVK